MEKYTFPLIDVVKYAKGHYKRTSSIWYDMALCLWNNGNGYGPFHSYSENIKKTPQEECYNSRRDICELIVSKIRKVLINKPFRMEELTRNTSPQDSWKVGYYTKGNSPLSLKREQELPEWEYWEAVLRAHLSELTFMTAEDLGYDNWDKFKENNIPELEKEQEHKLHEQ